MKRAAWLLALAACACSGPTPEPAEAPAPAEAPVAVGEPQLDEATAGEVRERLQHAGALFRQARFDEALEAAATAIERAPGHEPTYEVLSNWYTQLERHDLAVAAFERFAGAHPHALRYMARHQAVSGDREAATATLERCIATADRHAGCREERSALRLSVGDFAGAIEDLRIAWEVAPDTRTAARLADALRVTGAYGQSREVVDAGLAADPSSAELLIARAIDEARGRQDREAEASLRAAIELEPKSARALRLLGGLVLRRGDEIEGRFLLARADLYRDYRFARRALMQRVLATRDPRAIVMLAELEMTVGDYAQAQQWVDRARGAGADASRVAAAQAWIAYALGDAARGDAALARIPDENDGRAALARALRALRAGDPEGATTWLNRASSRGPAERSFLRRIADLHVAMGDKVAADEAFARAATAGFP